MAYELDDVLIYIFFKSKINILSKNIITELPRTKAKKILF